MQAMWMMAVVALTTVPMAWWLRGAPKAPAAGGAAASTLTLREQLKVAARDRSYWCLHAGFFTCGFQLAFVTAHLPSYLVDRGLPVSTGGWVLAENQDSDSIVVFKIDSTTGKLSPTGAKSWRFKYRVAGKEKVLCLGQYPDIGLKDARDLRDEARNQVALGVDPGAQRKAEKAAKIAETEHTFEAVARREPQRSA